MEDRKKTKILLVITKGNFGGAQRYVFDIATHLPQESYDVVVVYGNGDILPHKLQSAGIRTLHIESLMRDFSFTNEIKTIRALWNILHNENPDVLHLNSSKAGALGVCVGRAFLLWNKIRNTSHRFRIIFTGHGWAFNEERGIISRSAIFLGHYATLLLSHTVIAVSKSVASDVIRFPFIRNKVRIVYNGIETPEFLERKAARDALHIPHDAFVFGTLSELHPNKGLDIAIRSFASIAKHFPKARFVILGDGEEKTRLEAIANKFDITPSVQFCGYVKDGSSFLKAFDVFTLTSRTEAFPYALLEAGAAGLATIASRVGGIPEIISHKRSGLLVEPKNVFDIEYSMHELIRDESQRITLGNTLQEKTTTTFSLKAMIEETIRIYSL